MYYKRNYNIDCLLDEIYRDRDTYGGIILVQFHKCFSITQVSFTKNPIIYLINAVKNNSMFTFSQN